MLLAHFFLYHWSDILISLAVFFACTARVIPPEYAGLLKRFYNTTTHQWEDQQKQSLLDAVMTALTFTLTKGLTITVGLKGFATIISFGAVTVAVVLQRSISANVVVLVALGLLALYFEQLVDRAESFSLFKIFTYRARPVPPVVSTFSDPRAQVASAQNEGLTPAISLSQGNTTVE